MNETILLVEDNYDDAFLMKRALKTAGVTNPLQISEDGREALNYIFGQGKYGDRSAFPFPALIFLDLKLPFVMGLEVLAKVRENPEFCHVVIIVLTSSEEPSDLSESYRLGANSYIVKPPSSHQLVDLAHAFKLYWLKFNKNKNP